MTDNKKEKDLIEKSTTLSDSQKKQMKANMDQQKEVNPNDRADSDLYAKTEGQDPETGIEIPTDDEVEEAKDWVDNENRM